MSKSTHSSGKDNTGPPADPERNTPISRRGNRFKAGVDKVEDRMQRMGKGVKKGFKAFLGVGKPRTPREGETSAQGGDAHAGAGADTKSAKDLDDDGATSAQANARATSAQHRSGATSSGAGWAIAKGTLKTALSLVATLAPDPFKGPAEALMKVVDIIEVF
jgi:hypothetical protein